MSGHQLLDKKKIDRFKKVLSTQSLEIINVLKNYFIVGLGDMTTFHKFFKKTDDPFTLKFASDTILAKHKTLPLLIYVSEAGHLTNPALDEETLSYDMIVNTRSPFDKVKMKMLREVNDSVPSHLQSIIKACEVVGLDERAGYEKFFVTTPRAYLHKFDNPTILLKSSTLPLLAIVGERIEYKNGYIHN